MQNFTGPQVVTLIRALSKIETNSDQTRWNTPQDRLYSRAYRVACFLSTAGSWKGATVSPIGLYQLMANLETAREEAAEACDPRDPSFAETLQGAGQTPVPVAEELADEKADTAEGGGGDGA